MHRVLERLDGAASTVVPLLYLAGLMLGTFAYFTDLRPEAGLWIVGAALAFAAELHSFLAQRRCRALWGQFSRMATDTEARERILGQFRANLAILAALVAFSAFNSVAYVASTWKPAPGWVPDWAQIGIRGAIIPAFFLLAGFLSPLHADAGALLASASQAMLHKAIRATVKQWRQRIDRARRRGLDLAPVAVSLMLDAGDAEGARRIAMIADGLASAEASAPAALLAPTRGAAAGARAGVRVYDTLSSSTAPGMPGMPGVPGVPGMPGVPRSPSSTPSLDLDPDPDPTPPRPRGRSRRVKGVRTAPTSTNGAEGMGTEDATGADRAGVVLLSTAQRRTRQPRRTAEAQRRWREDTAAAARILAADPDIPTRELARRLDWTPVRATEVRRAIQPIRAAGAQVQARRPA